MGTGGLPCNWPGFGRAGGGVTGLAITTGFGLGAGGALAAGCCGLVLRRMGAGGRFGLLLGLPAAGAAGLAGGAWGRGAGAAACGLGAGAEAAGFAAAGFAACGAGDLLTTVGLLGAAGLAGAAGALGLAAAGATGLAGGAWGRGAGAAAWGLAAGAGAATGFAACGAAGALGAAFFTERMALPPSLLLAAGLPAAPPAPLPARWVRIFAASASLIELLWLLAAIASDSAAFSTSRLSRPRSRDSS